MNEQHVIKLRVQIEQYVFNKLKEIYWQFPQKISSNTTFKELEQYSDSDLTDPGLLIYIEEDLGVEISDEEALSLDSQNVAALINSIARHLQYIERS